MTLRHCSVQVVRQAVPEPVEGRQPRTSKAGKRVVFPTHPAFKGGKTHSKQCQNITFSALMLRICSISGLKYSINAIKSRFPGENAKRKAPPFYFTQEAFDECA